MAYIDTAEIRESIRVIVGGGGLLRNVPAGRIMGDYWAEAGDGATRARVLSKPRFDIQVASIERNPSSPSNRGSIVFYNLTFVLECAYDLASPVDTDAKRDEARAQAEQDADALSRALMINLGIGSDVMHGSCVLERVEPVAEDNERRILKTRQRYRCIVQATQ